MPVTALLDLHLRPDALDEASSIIAATLKDTRAFTGNLGIEVLADVADPTHVTIVEHWESMQHDDAYRAWRATPEGASNLRTIVAAAPVLTRTVLHDEI